MNIKAQLENASVRRQFNTLSLAKLFIWNKENVLLKGLIMRRKLKEIEHQIVHPSGTKGPRRRARHDIIMDILKIAKNGIAKTNIMYKAKLSYTQLEQYLKALEKAGFIQEKSGSWTTTEKGLHVIEACKICQRLVKEVQ